MYIETDSEIYVSKNFKAKEYNTGNLPVWFVHPNLIILLQKIRDSIGTPIKINSGYRDLERNKQAGGSTSSRHLRGMAADISIKNRMEGVKILRTSYIHGCRRMAISSTFVHVDVDTPVSGEFDTWKYGDVEPITHEQIKNNT
jgi:uncharacterized protein YcbK (DUF882 family)